MAADSKPKRLKNVLLKHEDKKEKNVKVYSSSESYNSSTTFLDTSAIFDGSLPDVLISFSVPTFTLP